MPAGLATFLAELIPVLINQTPLVLLLGVAILGFARGWWIMRANHREIIDSYEARLAERDRAAAEAKREADRWQRFAEANQEIAARALGRK